MSYDEVWKILADLITDFRRRSEIIPPHVMNDLRSAKTMIEILKADPTHVEHTPDIEAYLSNVESFLIFTAQSRFGKEYADRWVEKLEKARKKPGEEVEVKAAPRFVPGLPRGERWIRVQVSKDTTRRNIEKMAEESGLSSKMQDDGYMLVSGEAEKIKLFVKRMKEKFRGVQVNDRKL